MFKVLLETDFADESCSSGFKLKLFLGQQFDLHIAIQHLGLELSPFLEFKGLFFSNLPLQSL